MIIAIDFDGTCVDHRYPDVGADNPGAVHWLRWFVELDAKLILWTMRAPGSPSEGDEPANAAGRWFADRDTPLWAANHNPEQATWSTSPKVYAHVYIDDAAACCPLRPNPRMGGRPMVDWSVVGPAVENKLLIEQEERELRAEGWMNILEMTPDQRRELLQRIGSREDIMRERAEGRAATANKSKPADV